MLISALCKDICANFSGFSVGFCINEEKVICYQLELGMFQLNAPFTLTTTGVFSGNVGKLFSELKLVTNNPSLHISTHMYFMNT